MYGKVKMHYAALLIHTSLLRLRTQTATQHQRSCRVQWHNNGKNTLPLPCLSHLCECCLADRRLSHNCHPDAAQQLRLEGVSWVAASSLECVCEERHAAVVLARRKRPAAACSCTAPVASGWWCCCSAAAATASVVGWCYLGVFF